MHVYVSRNTRLSQAAFGFCVAVPHKHPESCFTTLRVNQLVYKVIEVDLTVISGLAIRVASLCCHWVRVNDSKQPAHNKLQMTIEDGKLTVTIAIAAVTVTITIAVTVTMLASRRVLVLVPAAVFLLAL